MAPPNFSDLEYWDARFSSTSTPFDWLVPATSLDSLILSSVRSKCNPGPEGRCKILHIGCGSSELSQRLGELAQDREDVWNTDYSRVAIEQGRAEEEGRAGRLQNRHGCKDKDEDKDEDTGRMHWEILDLLDPESISSFKESEFDLIVDKSTSDAISCGPDLPRTTLHSVSSITTTTTTSSTSTSTAIPTSQRSTPEFDPDPYPGLASGSNLLHPLNVLATNLARLTTPGGRWLTISYSSDRFPFFSSSPSSSSSPSPSPSHSPTKSTKAEAGQYWILEKKQEIEITTEIETSPGLEKGHVFRPKEVNYLYILVRTDVPVLPFRDV